MPPKRGEKRRKLAVPTEKDGLLALALARGKTQAQAAEAAGVGERTVTRRLEDPSFRALVDRLRERMVDRASGKLADVADRAIERLVRLLDDADPVVQLRASKVVLDQVLKYGSFQDLARQVREIREGLKARGHQ